MSSGIDVRDTLSSDRIDESPCYGIIAANATDLTDLVPIIIPDFDQNLTWGPCRWQSRDDVSLPAKGDECLVVFDNRRQPWIVAWWPFS